MTDDAPARRVRLSVRTRVLTAVLGAAALGMLVAGLTSYLVQRERVDSRIDENLSQEVGELRQFSSSGIDPETGAPFTSTLRFLEVFMQRSVPAPSEGLLAMVDGMPEWLPRGSHSLQLDEAPDFIAEVNGVSLDEGIRVRTAETSIGSLRYVVVPVTLDEDPAQGAYVIAYSRDLELQEINDAYQTYAIVASAALLVIGGVGWTVAGRLLRPIRLLRNTAQRISETDLSDRIPVTGHDDVSELARTANAMLERLESAFAGQREVLDDVGHELRTPITIIRGHLELMDAGDPAEVAEARSLALDELDRMQRIVDDLVMLAKAKRPDFVHKAPVELDRLVDEVVDKAGALAERRWLVDARADGVADLDEQRVTQALLQLISNAVKFTGPQDVIAVGSSMAGHEVRLWVRDTGEGIAARDLERIFERFSRVGTGRQIEGTGLGLAIVKAIVEAHHGRVSVESSPGTGSTFSLWFPASSDEATTMEMPRWHR